jgi:hypothetical protein
MIESALAQQLAPILAPVLPYLLKSTATVGKDAAKKALGNKFVEDKWNKATAVWKILQAEVEKKPEVAKELGEVIQEPNDPRTETILSWQIEKILKAMPPEKLNEIQGIVGESKSESRVTIATNRSIAIGGNATGNTMSTGDGRTK